MSDRRGPRPWRSGIVRVSEDPTMRTTRRLALTLLPLAILSVAAIWFRRRLKERELAAA